MVNQIKKFIIKHYQLKRWFRKIYYMNKGQIRDNNIHRYIIGEINKHDQYFQEV